MEHVSKCHFISPQVEMIFSSTAGSFFQALLHFAVGDSVEARVHLL
jgi:hypothetical protein